MEQLAGWAISGDGVGNRQGGTRRKSSGSGEAGLLTRGGEGVEAETYSYLSATPDCLRSLSNSCLVPPGLSRFQVRAYSLMSCFCHSGYGAINR